MNLGGDYNTPESVVKRCSELNTIALVNIEYPEIPLIDNCRLILDPGYTASYPWGGSSFFNIAGGNPTGGTLNGNVSFIQGQQGKGWADSFLRYGTDDWVNVSPFGGALTTFTINVWVNIGGAGNINTNLVSQRYSQDSGYTPETDCNFFIKGDGGKGFNGGLRISGNDYVVNSGNLSDWNNLTLTYDGNELVMYVNGGVVGNTAVSQTPVTNGLDTLIGGSVNGLEGGGSSDYFNGRIGAAHIYDVALDAGQVSEIYGQYVSRFI